MSTVLETIKKRRSIRRFRNDPVPQEALRELLEAACWAPSAGNLQPWEFYVVTNVALKRDLAAAASQRFVGEAQVVIVVCVVPERSAIHYGERGRKLYCLQDTAAAIQNILLAATSLGLGACWVGAFREERVIEALGLHPGKRPVALIPVGYPATEPRPTPRFSVDEVTEWI